MPTPPLLPFPTKLESIAKWETKVAFLVLTLVSLATASLYYLSSYYSNRIAPNVHINGVLVGGLTQEEALTVLRQENKQPSFAMFTLAVDDIEVSSSSAELPITLMHTDLVTEALSLGKHPIFLLEAFSILERTFKPIELSASPQFELEPLEEMIAVLQSKVELIGTKPSATLKVSGNPGSLIILSGSPGRSIDSAATISQVQEALKNSTLSTTAIVASTSSPLTDNEIAAARSRAEKFVGKNIVFTVDEQAVTIPDVELLTFLQLPSGFDMETIAAKAASLAEQYNRAPIPAVFSYDAETKKVDSFIPDRPGLTLDQDRTRTAIADRLEQVEAGTEAITPVELAFSEEPATTTLSETNNLGITERIGVGYSEYDHSIPSRIHNVAITAERITNHIVAPGEEFSFNQTLGEVSARTGFKPAYVIRAGKTELGDGGGVCQVSSTLFRALLDSGLDITRRLQHSYRVGYYELNSDPGFDATVYAGNVDLRFKNDTEHHVLIHIENDPNELSMRVELYGTSDGRHTEIVDYQKWGAVGPPAPEYILDPTLQPGQRVQIDWAVGGLKTKFTHKVYKTDGELLRENTYYSNYRPWSAKYRVGSLPN